MYDVLTDIDGSYLHEIRKQRNISMKDFAHECNYTVSYISQLESRKSKLTIDILDVILSKLNLTLSEFIYIKKNVDFIINEFCLSLELLDYSNADKAYSKLCMIREDMKKYFLINYYNIIETIYLIYHKRFNEINKEINIEDIHVPNINLSYSLNRIFLLHIGFYYALTNEYKLSQDYLLSIKSSLQEKEKGLYFYYLTILYIESNNSIFALENIQKSLNYFLKYFSSDAIIRNKINHAYLLTCTNSYELGILECNELLLINSLNVELRDDIINLKVWILIRTSEYKRALHIISNPAESDNYLHKFLSELLEVILSKKCTSKNNLILALHEGLNLQKYNQLYVYFLECNICNRELRLWVSDILIDFYRISKNYRKLSQILEKKVSLMEIR